MVFCQRNTLLHRSSTANVNGEGDRVLVLLCFCCVSIRVLLCTVLWASCAVSPAAMYVLCQHPVLCQHQSKCCYALCSVSSIWDCHSNGALTADSADCTVHCTRMNCSTHSSLSHSISFTALHNLHNMHGLVHCSTATVHCWLNGLQCSAGGSSQCTALQWRRQLVRLRGKDTAQCAHCAVQEEAGNANGVVTVGQSQGSTASQCKPLHTPQFTVQ